MLTDPLLSALFQTDAWATRQLLAECRALTPEQFERPLDLGPGSLERTLSHLVGAMFFFADRLNRRAPRPRPDRDGRAHTADELLALLDQADGEFQEAVAQTLATRALTDILNWTDTDDGPIAPSDQTTYAVALAQMIDHGIHHRAQAAEMLRQLGVTKPLDWHPFEWEEAMRGL